MFVRLRCYLAQNPMEWLHNSFVLNWDEIDYLIDNLCYVNLAMFVKTGFVNGSVLIKQ